MASELLAMATIFTNNANGDRAGEYDASGNQRVTYRYDNANHVTSVNNVAQNQTTRYGYDGFGNRVGQTIGSLTTNYLVDPIGSLPQILGEFPTGSGAPPSTVYTPGIGQDNGAMGYFGVDGLGSMCFLTDGSGAYSSP